MGKPAVSNFKSIKIALSGACNNFVSPEIECCIRIGSSQRCDLFTTCPTVAISQTISFSVYAHKKPIPEP